MNRLDYAPSVIPAVALSGEPYIVQQKVLSASDGGAPVFRQPDEGKHLFIPFVIVVAAAGALVWYASKEIDKQAGD